LLMVSGHRNSCDDHSAPHTEYRRFLPHDAINCTTKTLDKI
jgi:hypothetical protein